MSEMVAPWLLRGRGGDLRRIADFHFAEEPKRMLVCAYGEHLEM